MLSRTTPTRAFYTHAFRGLPLAAIATVVVACSMTEAPGSSPPAIGDPNPNGKAPGEECATGADCRTGVCTQAGCQPSTNDDDVKNGDESDVDCGGAAGPGCPNGKACATNANCASGLCTAFRCDAGRRDGGTKGDNDGTKDAGALDNAHDGKQNGGETDVDCGGPDKGVPRCADGKKCNRGPDCASGECKEGTCHPSMANDGVKNGDETDVDCGGSNPRKCGADKACLVGADCDSTVCIAATKKCTAPTFDDNIQDGGETDVDCGGPNAAPRCGVGKKCLDHSDCASYGCAYDNRCAMGATCTQLQGGQTCGPIDGMGRQNDCCDRARIGGFTIDKYLVTAGRMRAFITRLNGRIRDYAATLPASKWNPAWTSQLPNSIDGAPGDGNNANTQLGPFYGKRSCQSGNYNGHTYWTPLAYGDDKEDFPQEVLDTKALNCVPWFLLAALCIFDGGHLLKERELSAAYTNDNTTPYPWGARGSYTTSAANPYAVQVYGYGTPNPPPDARKNGLEFVDAAYYIAPPGRRPMGYNSVGIADLVGNVLEWVGDQERQFVWKGSWENHGAEADGIEAPTDNDPYMAIRPTSGQPWRWNIDISQLDPNGYYALGGRCAY